MEEEDVKNATESAVNYVNELTGLDKEDLEEVWDHRTKMTWVALWAMILPTIYIVLRISNPDVIEKLGVLLSWYYIALASVVGAFFGFKTWATIKGK